jgi:hypothetical protein
MAGLRDVAVKSLFLYNLLLFCCAAYASPETQQQVDFVRQYIAAQS